MPSVALIHYSHPTRLGRAVMPSKRSIRKSELKAQERARKLAILVNGKVLVSKETQKQLAEKAVQSKMETQKREFVLDTGASYHVCCQGWLTKKERKSIRLLPEPLFLNAADGIVEICHVVTVYVSDLRTHLKMCVFEWFSTTCFYWPT